MARGDFRYRPRYLFWSAIVTSVLFGAVAGWSINDQPNGSTVISIIIGTAGATALGWRHSNAMLFTGDRVIRPYDHPILGLYSGVRAAIVSLVLGNSIGFALLAGLIGGGTMLVLVIGYRRLNRRYLPPPGPGGTSTVTGWR